MEPLILTTSWPMDRKFIKKLTVMVLRKSMTDQISVSEGTGIVLSSQPLCGSTELAIFFSSCT